MKSCPNQRPYFHPNFPLILMSVAENIQTSFYSHESELACRSYGCEKFTFPFLIRPNWHLAFRLILFSLLSIEASTSCQGWGLENRCQQLRTYLFEYYYRHVCALFIMTRCLSASLMTCFLDVESLKSKAYGIGVGHLCMFRSVAPHPFCASLECIA